MILKLHLITFFAVQTIYKKRWSVRLLSYSSSFRRTLHNLIRQNHIEPWGNISKDQVMSNFSSYRQSNMIIYKKTDEWHIEWQWMTTNANEWQRMTTSDNGWQRMVQRVTKSGNEWYNKWQRVTTNVNQWQRVTAVAQRMNTAQYTSKNGWLPFFQWQKQIHYYFKVWMARIRVVK